MTAPYLVHPCAGDNRRPRGAGDGAQEVGLIVTPEAANAHQGAQVPGYITKEQALKRIGESTRLRPRDAAVLRIILGVSDAYLSTTVPRGHLAALTGLSVSTVNASLKRLAAGRWLETGHRYDINGRQLSDWIEVTIWIMGSTR